MKELVEMMKRLLATNFSLYLKAHNFHWNVTGVEFPQYHEFFGKIYGELFAATDLIAEEIRQLDAFAPGSLTRFKELSLIPDETNVSSAPEMVKILKKDNKTILDLLTKLYYLAEETKQHGLCNFIQDRIMAHNKLNWMLSSTSK
jgi:starvation-inducible DNA-binding protein